MMRLLLGNYVRMYVWVHVSTRLDDPVLISFSVCMHVCVLYVFLFGHMGMTLNPDENGFAATNWLS